MPRDKHEAKPTITVQRVREELQGKIDEAMHIIRDLADLYPMIPVSDEQVTRCMACELESPPDIRVPLEDHDEQCVWRRAKELVKRENSDEPE